MIFVTNYVGKTIYLYLMILEWYYILSLNLQCLNIVLRFPNLIYKEIYDVSLSAVIQSIINNSELFLINVISLMN